LTGAAHASALVCQRPFRIVQAIGAAALITNTTAVVADAFPATSFRSV
jgi:hypothetical protein